MRAVRGGQATNGLPASLGLCRWAICKRCESEQRVKSSKSHDDLQKRTVE